MAQVWRAGGVRSFLVTFHRWVGLVAGVWLFIAAITGSILVFSDEIDRALNPEFLVAKPGEVVSVDRVVASIEEGFPGYFASSINLPNEADENFTVFTKPLDKSVPSRPSVQIFVDARTGDVLGSRDRGENAFSRIGFTRLVTKLHYTLLAEDTGKWIFGLLAALWCVGHLIGAVIAFPTLKRWAQSFTIPRSAKGFKFDFRAHRAMSLWMFPVTLIISFTALYLNWNDYFRSAVEGSMEVAEPYDKRVDVKPEGFLPRVSVQAALDLVKRQEPGIDVDGVSVLRDKGLYRFRVFDKRDIDTTSGQRQIYVDSETGVVCADEHVASSKPGNIFLAWQFPLHSGKAFGWLGRILVFIAGLATCYIIATGYMMYFKRKALKAKKNNSGKSSSATFASGK